MKLLLLTWSYLPQLGGVQRSVANLSAELAGAGHEVTVATHAWTAFPFRREGPGNPFVLRLHLPSQAVRGLRARTVTAILDRVNDAVLARFARARGIELVHGHHLNADSIYGVRLAKRLRIPFVLTIRGGEVEEWIAGDARRRRYLVRVLSSADFVTAVSRSLLEGVRAHAPEIAARSAVIPNAVDALALEKALPDAGAPDGRRPFLLFAGRLAWMKDVGCLLDAYHALWRDRSPFPWDLVVAGEGPWRRRLERRGRQGWGRAGVRFAGRLSHAETLRLVRDARAVVLPSRSSEGCPNLVLEAMALGTPVVVSDLPSLVELVEDGVTGSVFPRGDARALAGRLRQLAADPERGEAHARAARARVAERHAPGAVREAYEAIYARLASDAASARTAS